MKHSSLLSGMCVLVVSCDKYEDCWEPFSLCIDKFWPDCPYPIYLATESKSPTKKVIFKKVLHSVNRSWTGRLREFCQQIDESYILLVLEDQWLASFIASDKVQNILRTIQSNVSIGTIYLDYTAKSLPVWENDSNFYVIPTGTPYRLSVGPSIWAKDFLLSVCQEDVDAWNFERIQSFSPASLSHTVLASVEHIYHRVPPLGAIRRGKWEPTVPKFCKDNNLSIDLSQRKVIGFGEIFLIKIKSFIFNLNPSFIVSIQNRLYNFHHRKI